MITFHPGNSSMSEVVSKDSTQLAAIKLFNPCADIKSKHFFERLSELEEIINNVLPFKRKNLCWKLFSNYTSSQTSRLCLPNFYVAGFPKCGTTTFYNILVEHQQIAHPKIKETHIWRNVLYTWSNQEKERFLRNFLRNVNPQYSSLKNISTLTFDSSATLIYDLPYNIQHFYHHEYCLLPFLHKNVNPDTKYIVLMRNPVEHLWSSYRYFCRKNPPKAEMMATVFHEIVRSELDSFNKCLANNSSDFFCAMESGNGGFPYLHIEACRHVRLGVSLYYFHIVRWLSVFPRKHFLFIRTRELAAEPRNVLTKVSDFLGIPSFPATPHMLKVSNTHANKYSSKKGSEMMQETRDLLNTFFRPYNEMLALLLDDQNFLWNV